MTRAARIGAVAWMIAGLTAGSEPPRLAEPKAFRLPPKATLELANGVTAVLVPFGAMPKVTVAAVVRTGQIDETAEQVWLSRLTARLMQEGAGESSGRDLRARVGAMGGVLEVESDTDRTFVTSDVLSEHGVDLVRLVADVVRRPALPAAEFARVRSDLERDLAIELADPSALADQAFLAEIYGDHPYGRPYPTPQALAGFTLDQVREFHAANFGARRTRIFVVGRFDEAAMTAAIGAAFEDWEQGPEPRREIPAERAARRLVLVDRPGAEQSTLRIGLRTADPSAPEYTALEVTNFLLGNAFGSRIVANIREDKGYAYSPYSVLVSGYRATHWVEMADVTTAVTGPALREIFHEIERLGREAPPADELERMRNFAGGIFVLRNSTRGRIVRQLANLDLHGLGDEYLSGYVERVRAVTPEGMRELAAERLDSSRMTVVVVGDLEKIERQLREVEALAD